MYTSWTYITEPIGNNEFSYSERINLWSVGESPASLGKISVPSLKVWTTADLEIGSEIVFEEVEKEQIRSFCGLKHFIATTYEWVPIYIIDNHNHALSFRYEHRMKTGTNRRMTLIHIDQHADTKECKATFDMKNPAEDIEDFVNQKTNVGNFITAAMNSGIFTDVIQIRTDYALQHIQQSMQKVESYILDIDMDFREGKDDHEKDFAIIRRLIPRAKLVTIATSPYFFDQEQAITLIKRLLQ